MTTNENMGSLWLHQWPYFITLFNIFKLAFFAYKMQTKLFIFRWYITFSKPNS
jgi:hypothetical protein